MESNIFLRKTKKFMIPKREITSQFFFAVYIILHKVLCVGGVFISCLLIGHAFYEAPFCRDSIEKSSCHTLQPDV